MSNRLFSIVVVWVVAGVARAEDTQLKAEVEALKAQVAELRAENQGNWLNERRKEEIKSLIHEVVADAETRASLKEGGVTAGWNKHFFLASEDGNFLMEVSGYVQTRYIANFRDEPSEDEGGKDDFEGGFQIRRAKVAFEGHVFDPKLEYKVQFAAERDGGLLKLEDAYTRYEFADGYFVQAGQFKPRFNREELMSAMRQQAMERSVVNGFFRISRPTAVQVMGEYERWNWAVSVHDGREAENTDFNTDRTDVAFAGRAEYLVAGEWKQFKDYVAWPETPFGLMVGGGVDYEIAESGRGTSFAFDDFWQWTGDASLQLDPFNIFVAGYGRHLNGDSSIGGVDQIGFLVQAGVFVIPGKMDVFGRGEWLDHGGFTEVKGNPSAIDAGLEDQIFLLTAGTNYYFQKHDVKLTLDVVWAPDGVRTTETGAGLLESGNNEEQVAIRGQLQLLF